MRLKREYIRWLCLNIRQSSNKATTRLTIFLSLNLDRLPALE